YIPWFHHQITKYGLERRGTGGHAMQVEPGQNLKAYESQELADEDTRLFSEKAKPLVASGGRVLVPGGGGPRLLFSGGPGRAGAPSMGRRSSTASRSSSRWPKWP